MKLNKRGPAFQFYPDKWMVATMRLSDSAFRLYNLMLCWMWLESTNGCTMPTDINFISTALSLPKAMVSKGITEIQLPGMELFRVNRRNKKGATYVSFGLKKEYKKQTEWRKKSAEGGKASAKAKKDKELQSKGGSTTVPTKGQPKANIPSPSVSPIVIPIPEEEDDPGFVSFENSTGKRHDKPDGTVLDKIMVIAIKRLIIRNPGETRQYFSNAVTVKKWLTWAQLFSAVQGCPKDSYPRDVILPFEKKLDPASAIDRNREELGYKKAQAMAAEEKRRKEEYDNLSPSEKQALADKKKAALDKIRRITAPSEAVEC